MGWFFYGMLLLAIGFVIAIIAILMGKRKHWAVQLIAIAICATAMYCHVQAEMNGEYHELSQKIATPLVKEVLQPFALSDLGQKTMSALQYTIDVLNSIINFIDQYKIALTIILTAVICFISWAWSDRKKR